jgi:hypothetical protein
MESADNEFTEWSDWSKKGIVPIKQTPQQIDEAWTLLYDHLCVSQSSDGEVDFEYFIEVGKKEFIIIPINNEKK